MCETVNIPRPFSYGKIFYDVIQAADDDQFLICLVNKEMNRPATLWIFKNTEKNPVVSEEQTVFFRQQAVDMLCQAFKDHPAKDVFVRTEVESFEVSYFCMLTAIFKDDKYVSIPNAVLEEFREMLASAGKFMKQLDAEAEPEHDTVL